MAKKSSRKKARKTARKTTRAKVQGAAPKTVAVPTAAQPKAPVPKKGTKTIAWVGFLTNLLVLPGLGTLIQGNFSEGALQLLLALVGVLFFVMTYDIILSFVILAVALVWSMYSSINYFNQTM